MKSVKEESRRSGMKDRPKKVAQVLKPAAKKRTTALFLGGDGGRQFLLEEGGEPQQPSSLETPKGLRALGARVG